jgi:hypothetical protein
VGRALAVGIGVAEHGRIQCRYVPNAQRTTALPSATDVEGTRHTIWHTPPLPDGQSDAARASSRPDRLDGLVPMDERPGRRVGAFRMRHRSQWTSSRTRSGRSTAHPIAQVKHPVALNYRVSIFQQVLRVD